MGGGVLRGCIPIWAPGRAASRGHLGPDTFFPSFFQSWCSCRAQERSVASAIFSRNRGLGRQGRGFGAQHRGRARSAPVRAVPVFPVLRDPGLQLLPRGPEVLLEEGLQLRPGDAVVVGAGQLAEGLQDLVWGGGTGRSVGPVTPSLMGVRPLPSLVGIQEQGGPGRLTWSGVQRHVHELLVVLVELGHLHLAQELPVAVNVAAERGGGAWARPPGRRKAG